MTWFKVDDKLHDHRKARAAGTAAMGVWVLAGSWAADNLTDGFVPAAILPRWGRPRDATRLVEVGLWHADEQDGEKGWRFHEWHERQPSRAQKLAEREVRAKAGKAGGLASGRSRAQANGKQVASGALEPPTRPDPTRSKDTTASATADQEFDEFWALYPKRKDKGHAVKAYRTARKKADHAAILAGVRRCVGEWRSTSPEFIPFPATWLNGERWADEAPRQLTAVPDDPGALPPVEQSWMRRRPQ